MTARVALAVLATAALPGLPPAAQKTLEHGWCNGAAYARAEHADGVDRILRTNLRDAARVAHVHHAGCVIGERFAHARAEPFNLHGPWMRRGRHGDACPRDPLPLRRGDRVRAEQAAAAAEPHASMPIVVATGERMAHVRYACGAEAARRTVTVSSMLVTYVFSASLSERVVSVAHFRRYGWRVYQLQH